MLWFCSWVLSQEWRDTTSSWYCWYLSSSPDRRPPSSDDCDGQNLKCKNLSNGASRLTEILAYVTHLGVQICVSVIRILQLIIDQLLRAAQCWIRTANLLLSSLDGVQNLLAGDGDEAQVCFVTNDILTKLQRKWSASQSAEVIQVPEWFIWWIISVDVLQLTLIKINVWSNSTI